MMKNQSSDQVYDYCSVVDLGEATGCGGDGGGGAEGFLDMFGDHHSSGDLFDLVWQGGQLGDSSGRELQPSHHLPSSSPPAAIVLPPSEDEMAAWLYPIVRGDDELVITAGQDDQPGDLDGGHAGAVDDQQAAPVKEAPDHKKAGAARKSHHAAEAHNLTEKRRRCKINEKFKTLQQLVPGCDKSSQLSTLDQTIQYMRSLQQQIQAMLFGCGVNPTVVYPVVVAPSYLPPPATVAPAEVVRGQVQPGVVLAPPPAMVSYRALLPLVHHHQHPAAAAPRKGTSSARVAEDNSTSRNREIRGNCLDRIDYQ